MFARFMADKKKVGRSVGGFRTGGCGEVVAISNNV